MTNQTQEGLDNKFYDNNMGNTIDDGSNYIKTSPVTLSPSLQLLPLGKFILYQIR